MPPVLTTSREDGRYKELAERISARGQLSNNWNSALRSERRREESSGSVRGSNIIPPVAAAPELLEALKVHQTAQEESQRGYVGAMTLGLALGSKDQE